MRPIPSSLLAISALLGAAGCSGGPAPTAELARAHSLVEQADQSGAQQYASTDLAAARSKLQQADLDARKEPARSLGEAQEASADARVALARTSSGKAQAALRDVQSGNRDLQHEADRQSLQDETSPPTPPSTPNTAAP